MVVTRPPYTPPAMVDADGGLAKSGASLSYSIAK